MAIDDNTLVKAAEMYAVIIAQNKPDMVAKMLLKSTFSSLDDDDITAVKKKVEELAQQAQNEMKDKKLDVGLNVEEWEKAQERVNKFRKTGLPDIAISKKILDEYPLISNEQLIELKLEPREKTVAKAPIVKESPLVAADFSKSITAEIIARIRKLTQDEIIHGNFLVVAANYQNAEAISKLLVQLKNPKEELLEAGFIELLKNACAILTKYDKDQEKAASEKGVVSKENIEISMLANLDDINNKIAELKLDRKELDEKIQALPRQIAALRDRDIIEISKKYMVDKRAYLTTEVGENLAKIEVLKQNAKKNLGEALGKYVTLGINLESKAVKEALDPGTGDMKGNNNINARRLVYGFIANGKNAKNKQDTGKKATITSTTKSKKPSNLIDEPKALSLNLESAIAVYSSATKADKETKKAAVLDLLYNELVTKNAELHLLAKNLTDGDLKKNLENYIKETNEYHIYRALGLKKGEVATPTMALDQKEISRNLESYLQEELKDKERLKTYKINPEKAEERAREILQDLGLSEKVINPQNLNKVANGEQASEKLTTENTPATAKSGKLAKNDAGLEAFFKTKLSSSSSVKIAIPNEQLDSAVALGASLQARLDKQKSESINTTSMVPTQKAISQEDLTKAPEGEILISAPVETKENIKGNVVNQTIDIIPLSMPQEQEEAKRRPLEGVIINFILAAANKELTQEQRIEECMKGIGISKDINPELHNDIVIILKKVDKTDKNIEKLEQYCNKIANAIRQVCGWPEREFKDQKTKALEKIQAVLDLNIKKKTPAAIMRN